MPARNGPPKIYEAHTYNDYRVAATEIHDRLFRNNVGVLFDRRGQRVRVGLHPGSGDLIGWHTVTITPEHVGATLAVFLSVEVKVLGGKTKKTTQDRQENWRNAVENAGGIGLRCYTVEEMREALRDRKYGEAVNG